MSRVTRSIADREKVTVDYIFNLTLGRSDRNRETIRGRSLQDRILFAINGIASCERSNHKLLAPVILQPHQRLLFTKFMELHGYLKHRTRLFPNTKASMNKHAADRDRVSRYNAFLDSHGALVTTHFSMSGVYSAIQMLRANKRPDISHHGGTTASVTKFSKGSISSVGAGT